MHIETERLNNRSNYTHGAIDPRLLKDSQEFYALAVLRALYPSKYTDLKKKTEDRPDLKSIRDEYGVEVTTADSNEDNADNRLFSQYRDSRDEKLKKKIEGHKKQVVEDYGVVHMSSSGGFSETGSENGMSAIERENQLLIKSISKKIDSAKKYASKFGALELVVIKNERVPSIWEIGILDCMNKAIEEREVVFKKVYFIYHDTCYCVTSDGQHEKKHIENTQRLRLLARLTAEGIISPEDYEWAD